MQITPLTKEHSKEVADLFDPAKAAAATAAEGTPSSTPTENEPYSNIYALGDCCANQDSPLPPLAQVAEQQGKYLAHVLNEEAKNLNPFQGQGQGSEAAKTQIQPFRYHHLGSMATVGGTSAILQLGGGNADSFKIGPKSVSIAGFLSWIAWRSAYLTRLGSLRARMQVAFDWTVTIL